MEYEGHGLAVAIRSFSSRAHRPSDVAHHRVPPLHLDTDTLDGTPHIDDKRYPRPQRPLRVPSRRGQRVQTENPHLSEAQARHLTVHDSNQNEDGACGWKFDNYVRTFRRSSSSL